MLGGFSRNHSQSSLRPYRPLATLLLSDRLDWRQGFGRMKSSRFRLAGSRPGVQGRPHTQQPPSTSKNYLLCRPHWPSYLAGFAGHVALSCGLHARQGVHTRFRSHLDSALGFQECPRHWHSQYLSFGSKFRPRHLFSKLGLLDSCPSVAQTDSSTFPYSKISYPMFVLRNPLPPSVVFERHYALAQVS